MKSLKKLFFIVLAVFCFVGITSCGGDGIPNLGLQSKRSEAIVEISNYKSLDLYRDEEQTTIQLKLSSAIVSINAADSEDEINDIIAEFKAAVDALKTKAEYEAEENNAELTQYKADASALVEGYKSASNYREAEQASLQTLINNAKSQITAATSKALVDQAVNTFKAAADLLKTKAQYEAEESALVTHKTTAKGIIDAYATLANYREAEQAEITALIASHKELVDNATTTALVDDAVKAYKDLVDEILTDAQLTALENALEDSKAAALVAVEEFLTENADVIDENYLNAIYENYGELFDSISEAETVLEVEELLELLLVKLQVTLDIFILDQTLDFGENYTYLIIYIVLLTELNILLDESFDVEEIQNAYNDLVLFVENPEVNGFDLFKSLLLEELESEELTEEALSEMYGEEEVQTILALIAEYKPLFEASTTLEGLLELYEEFMNEYMSIPTKLMVYIDYGEIGYEIFYVNPGEVFEQPEDPVMEGYIFIGWFDFDGNKIDFTKAITEDTFISAKFDLAPVTSVVVEETFDAPFDIPNDETVEEGFYYRTTGDGDPTGITAVVEGGLLKLNDTINNATLEVHYKVSSEFINGVYEISATFPSLPTNGSWTWFALVPVNGSIIEVRTISGGIALKNGSYESPAGGRFAYTSVSDITINIVYNSVTGHVSLTVSNATTSKTIEEQFKVSGLQSVRFMTAGGSRSYTVGNLNISHTTSSLTDVLPFYIASINEIFDAIVMEDYSLENQEYLQIQYEVSLSLAGLYTADELVFFLESFKYIVEITMTIEEEILRELETEIYLAEVALNEHFGALSETGEWDANIISLLETLLEGIEELKKVTNKEDVAGVLNTWIENLNNVPKVVLSIPVLTLEGNILSWEAVENADAYVVYINGVENEVDPDVLEYPLETTTPGRYIITVIAKSYTEGVSSSLASEEVVYDLAGVLSAPVISKNAKSPEVIEWEKVDGADAYEVYVDDVLATTVTALTYTAADGGVIGVIAINTVLPEVITASVLSNTVEVKVVTISFIGADAITKFSDGSNINAFKNGSKDVTHEGYTMTITSSSSSEFRIEDNGLKFSKTAHTAEIIFSDFTANTKVVFQIYNSSTNRTINISSPNYEEIQIKKGDTLTEENVVLEAPTNNIGVLTFYNAQNGTYGISCSGETVYLQYIKIYS